MKNEFSVGYTVSTTVEPDEGKIFSKITFDAHGCAKDLSTQVIETQDKQVREALISMGWTPPTDTGE